MKEDIPRWSFAHANTAESVGDACSQLPPMISEFLAQHQVPGIAVGVVVGGDLVWSGGYGSVRVGTTMVPNTSHIFRIASMTKSVTALATLMLRDRGLLRLDDEVRSFLPELNLVNEQEMDGAALSVRHLLSMAGGLVEDDPWADRQLDLNDDYFGEMLRGGVLMTYPAATAFEYSNLGYALLGRIFRVAAGETVQRFVEREIFQPLNMSDTTWNVAELDSDRVVPGYRLRGGAFELEPLLGDGAFAPMGGLATSLRDLARLVGLHLSAWPPRGGGESTLVRRSTLREMAQVQRASNEFPHADSHGYASTGYGFGLSCSVHERFGRVVGHGGALPGFSSYMEWLPDCGIGVVALSNRTYRPINSLVRACCATLEQQGVIQARRLEPSDLLQRAQRSVIELYEGRSPEALGDSQLPAVRALETLVLDLDDARQYPDFAALRSAMGPVVEVGPVRPIGLLRGSWEMICERGSVDVSVMLGPTVPIGLQFIRCSVVSV